MRVLCLSACRTSEITLKSALGKLGYRVFGMADNTKDPQLFLGAWKGAVDHKYHLENPAIKKGASGSASAPRRWGRKEFDGVMADYDAFVGVPTCLFVDELLEAYPEAKLILNVRDKHDWVDSMRVAAGEMVSWRGWDWLIKYDKGFSGPLIALIRSQMAVMSGWPRMDFGKGGFAESCFEKEQAKIRSRVSGSRLLEWKVGVTRWDEVCRFLEVESPPDGTFANLDEDEDDRSILRFQKMLWWMGFARVALRLGSVYIGGPLIAWLVWQRQDAILTYMRQITASMSSFIHR